MPELLEIESLEDLELELFIGDDGFGHARRCAESASRPEEPLFPNRTCALIIAEREVIATHKVDAEAAADAAAADADTVAADKDIVAADKATTLGYRNEAETFKNQAAAAAASTQFPVGNTAGTAGAYTVDFDPNLTIVDGAAFRLNLHATNSDGPTLAIDGGAAREMVRDDGTTIKAGELPSGYTVVAYYEAALNKYVVLNLQRKTWYNDTNANGNQLKNLRRWSGQIIYRGTIENMTDELVGVIEEPERWHNIAPLLGAGSCDFTLKKNGTPINFGAGPSTTVGATTARTVKAVNHSALSYIDWAAGDVCTISISNIATATRLTIGIDKTENLA